MEKTTTSSEEEGSNKFILPSILLKGSSIKATGYQTL